MLALRIYLPPIIWMYLIMSVGTFVLYFTDKIKAVRGAWRVSEGMLHLCELLGGWPGAFVAQRFFRHKYRKRDYMLVYWGIVAVHALAWAWYLGWMRW